MSFPFTAPSPLTSMRSASSKLLPSTMLFLYLITSNTLTIPSPLISPRCSFSERVFISSSRSCCSRSSDQSADTIPVLPKTIPETSASNTALRLIFFSALFLIALPPYLIFFICTGANRENISHIPK